MLQLSSVYVDVCEWRLAGGRGGVQIEMCWEELKSSDQWPDDDLKDQPGRHSKHSTKLYLSTTNHNFDMILPSNWRWVEFYL